MVLQDTESSRKYSDKNIACYYPCHGWMVSNQGTVVFYWQWGRLSLNLQFIYQ